MDAEEYGPLSCELCSEPWAHEYYCGRELLHRYCEAHDQAATLERDRILARAYADELSAGELGAVVRVSAADQSRPGERQRESEAPAPCPPTITGHTPSPQRRG